MWIQRDWLSEFAWLAYDEKEGEMFCKVCKLSKYIADKSSSFFSGNKSFHVSNIKDKIKAIVILMLFSPIKSTLKCQKKLMKTELSKTVFR